MGRQIVTEREAVPAMPMMRGVGLAGEVAAAPTPPLDEYKDRLLKFIPAEVVTVYLGLQGLVQSGTTDVNTRTTLLWLVFIALLVLTLLYLNRLQGVSKIMQLAISTVSFGVWVFAVGGPFATLSWYQPLFGAVLLPLFTLVVAIIKPEH